MFQITTDHLCEPGEASREGAIVTQMPLYGIERAMGESPDLTNDGPTVRFRLYDDDGELLYSGVLTDDDECNNQTAALRWGESDAGATVIKVCRHGKWIEEIS